MCDDLREAYLRKAADGEQQLEEQVFNGAEDDAQMN